MFESLRRYGSLVKFSHSIFALPFALSMALVCNQIAPITLLQLFWIVVAMVSARTAAMGFNRLVDRHIDAANPRTANREIPAGVVTVANAGGLVAVSSMTFLLASGALGEHCLMLAPFVLAWLFFYSYCKRCTSFAHLVLGISLAMAPGGVWYALIGTFAWEPVSLMAAVALWVAGFDIIYACQDVGFDRAVGLYSVPARLGVANALFVSRLLHGAAALCFATFGYIFALSAPFWIGFAVFLLLIASQHRLVSANDLSRADAAFFTRNGMASVVFLLAVAVALRVTD